MKSQKKSYNTPLLAAGPFILNSRDLTAEDRVQGFRVTASPIARKLAGLLAAAPMISLPIVRLIQETLLRESQQVHVAEVFLGGLLKPLSVATVFKVKSLSWKKRKSDSQSNQDSQEKRLLKNNPVRQRG
jgi:hypothetical protein